MLHPFILDSSYVFAAYDASIKSHQHSPAPSKPVSLFPTAFSIFCTQQIWPVLCRLTNSIQRRSVEVNAVDIKQAEQWGGCLSPLTIILDSGANLNIFSNADLLEQVKHVPSLAKRIRGAAGLFHCNMLERLTSNLGDLPLPTSDYYYSPSSMANILSLATLSKSHQIYMDTNLDNAFYVFDEKGRYLCF